MFFWERKKHNRELRENERRIRESQERHIRKGKEHLLKYTVDNMLKRKVEFNLYKYRNEALKIATHIPQEGKTKGDIMALAYRQIWNDLTLQKYELIWGEELRNFMTHEQKQTRFNQYKQEFLKHIEAIEQEERQKRTQLYKNDAHLSAKIETLIKLSEELEAREKEIDAQRVNVQEKIKALESQLKEPQEHTTKPHRPDLDRLEVMLNELRRLKQ